MIKPKSIALYNALIKSKKSIRLYLNGDFERDLFEVCIRTVQRQIVLDIYISKSCILNIENKPFILNKFFDLKSRGANIYVSKGNEDVTQYTVVCQVDFSLAVTVNINNESGELETSRAEKIFNALSLNSTEYRSDSSDIKAEFNSLNYDIIKGSSTTISWDVKNADDVIIDGLGKVEKFGTRAIKILDSTFLTLKASNKNQKKYKAIYLRAVDGLKINFDVLFFNPASKQYASLKTDDNNDGVFGISKDHKVKIIWKVEHAEAVEVEPFGIHNKSGEYAFTPEGTLEVNIKATLQGKVTNQRIIIHQYPMLVFNDKMIRIKDDFYSEAKFSYKDLRNEAFSFISAKNNLKSLDELKIKLNEQEKMLMDKAQNLRFNSFYEEHSIPRLNINILDRLKAYFKDKPEVKKMLDTLPHYNNVD